MNASYAFQNFILWPLLGIISVMNERLIEILNGGMNSLSFQKGKVHEYN